MDEFGFIGQYFAPLAGPEGLGLLDDAACFTPAPGFDLVITKDTMVEGVHFPNGFYGENVAGKLMCANLSDLAAKGAEPLGYFLSLAWPDHLDMEAFTSAGRNFAVGLEAIQDRFGLTLWGGDTVKTPGPFVATATLIGQVRTGRMSKRSGAQYGHDVWVTGTIGDAYLSLENYLGNFGKDTPDPEAIRKWDKAYWRPVPRLNMADLLMDAASASVDISDGLIADIGHIARASHVRMDITLNEIPLSREVRNWVMGADSLSRLMCLAAGGDDYEVAFTAAPEKREEIEEASKIMRLPITRIGVCEPGHGVVCRDALGHEIDLEEAGYKHF